MKKILPLLIFVFSIQGLFAQRNVVLLIADDLSTYYCGFYENHLDTAKLPNIQKLLATGVRFTNGMSNPVCSPTRAGIYTGRYSFRTGVGNFLGKANNETALDTAEISITRLLNIYMPVGLNSACIGKWHLQQPLPTSNLMFPITMGFDYYEGCFSGSLKSYTNWTKHTNGVASTCTNYATTETVNNAVNWIKAQGSTPFFLWLAFNAPHIPYHLPPANLHSYQGLSGTKADIDSNPKPYFLASLEALDHEIGRLFDSLQVINKMDSTDFIFIGDNGDETDVAQNIAGAKGSVFQEGINVPFIISGPSVVNPGRVSSALVNTQDLFATILELFGDTTWQTQIPVNKPVDSKSIMPILKNDLTAIRPWAFTEIFKVINDTLEGKAIRNMDYKLMRFDDGREALYCLITDPLELDNLLDSTLTSTQTTNYLNLCQELTTLLGGCGSYCNAPLAVTKSSMPVFCFGGATGNIHLNVTGGTPPYSYLWSNGATTRDLDSIIAGDYAVTITDLCNNIINADETIIQVSEINISNTLSPTTCGNANGAINTAITNGISPYDILWSNGSTEQSLTNIAAGTYTITVTDGFGCTATASKIINGSTLLQSSISFGSAICGKNTGNISVSVVSGTAPYSYNWSNGKTVSSMVNIGSKTYTVTVTDAAGCTNVDSVFLYCIPKKPAVIYGPQTICTNQKNVTYSVDPVVGATVYTWSKPGKSTFVSGQGTSTIVLNFGNQGGNVQVKTGNAYGFSYNTAMLVTMLSTCKEGEDLVADDLLLFPNPFQDKLKLSFSTLSGFCKLRITNVLGQLIYNESLAVQNGLTELELNLENANKGIYFLQLEYNDTLVSKKITKE